MPQESDTAVRVMYPTSPLTMTGPCVKGEIDAACVIPTAFGIPSTVCP